ncbi:MAG: DNA polymerase III subunit gamma/tau, partial [bacterium]
MLTLYRKYRPQRFEEVIGQETVVRTITKELASGKTAHAYVFAGPRGIGKTTIARLFAKSLQCEEQKDGSYEPCGQCRQCQAIASGSSLDVLEIDAASQTGVDNVRENIIQGSRFAPQSGKWKVFIIDEAHMLSGAAFNALLKTLEEPPSHAVFILATTELHKIPATVVSRCQRFTFHRPSLDLLVERLVGICGKEKVTVEEGVLRTIAYLASGSTRDAESLLGQVLSLGLPKITVDDALLVLPKLAVGESLSLTEAMLSGNGTEAMKLLQKLEADGESLEFFLRVLLDVWQELLVATFSLALSKDGVLTKEEIQKFMDKKDVADVRVKLRQFVELGITAKGHLRMVDDPLLALTILVAKGLELAG